MKFKIRIIFSMMAVALLISVAIPACAGDIKTRMLERLPEIQDLKTDGVVGEDKNGFLQFRKAAGGKEALISSENADRLEVYKAIAAKQGVSVEVVGQRRALQIAERAGKGEWLQSADGNWYQK